MRNLLFLSHPVFGILFQWLELRHTSCWTLFLFQFHFSGSVVLIILLRIRDIFGNLMEAMGLCSRNGAYPQKIYVPFYRFTDSLQPIHGSFSEIRRNNATVSISVALCACRRSCIHAWRAGWVASWMSSPNCLLRSLWQVMSFLKSQGHFIDIMDSNLIPPPAGWVIMCNLPETKFPSL